MYVTEELKKEFHEKYPHIQKIVDPDEKDTILYLLLSEEEVAELESDSSVEKVQTKERVIILD